MTRQITLTTMTSSTAGRGAPDRADTRASGVDGAPSLATPKISRAPATAAPRPAPKALNAAPSSIRSRIAEPT